MIGLLLVICIVLFLGGVTVYAHFFDKGDNPGGLPDFPSVKKAEYQFYLVSTRSFIFTDDYEIVSHNSPKKYLLHGYWENTGGKYKHRDGDLPLDEKYFGKIIISRRVE